MSDDAPPDRRTRLLVHGYVLCVRCGCAVKPGSLVHPVDPASPDAAGMPQWICRDFKWCIEQAKGKT